MDKLEFLSKVPLLSYIKKRELKKIAELAQVQHYRDGEVVFREGERDGRLFVVASGEVDVILGLDSKRPKVLRTMGPYSYLGELALINDMVRTASVVAKGDAALLCLDGFNLRAQMEKHPGMAVEVLQLLTHRFQEKEARLLKAVEGMLPICANCKKIRDEDNNWVPIEQYFHERSDTDFTHSMCPDCIKLLYPELSDG